MMINWLNNEDSDRWISLSRHMRHEYLESINYSVFFLHSLPHIVSVKEWWSVSLVELQDRDRALNSRTPRPLPTSRSPRSRAAGRGVPAAVAEEWRSVTPLLSLSVNSVLLLRAETHCRKQWTYTSISMAAAVTHSLTCCVTTIKALTCWLRSFLTSSRWLKWKGGGRLVHTRWQRLISHQPLPVLTAGLVTVPVSPCPSPTVAAAKCNIEPARRKDCLFAATVARLSTGRRRWRSTNVSTRGRSLSAALHVGRCFLRPGTWGNTREFTQERNHTAVGCVAGDLPG